MWRMSGALACVYVLAWSCALEGALGIRSTELSPELESKKPKDLDEAVRHWLQDAKDDDETIARLNALVESFGAAPLNDWTDQPSKHQHRLIHMLVMKGLKRVLEHAHLTHKFDINAQRASDQCTPSHLAIWYGMDEIREMLWALGADRTLENKYGETADQKWQAEREKREQLVFLDVEWVGSSNASEGKPQRILEIAMVITDKRLQEKARGHWVVGGFEKADLDSMEEFSQQHFRDSEPGGEFPPLDTNAEQKMGNGLFSEVLASDLTLQQIEEAMLAMLQKHCPPQACALAGYSVQCDRELLLLQMPRVHAFLSHQIVDLVSVLRMGNMWLPELMQTRSKDRKKYNHRAMNDVEDSIQTMGWIRDNMLRQKDAPMEGSN